MNNKLIDYIRHLSKEDKKNLTEKVLKTGEEFGELAKVALPYASAYATNHRFVQKERILEEAVDTVLCALSVAYDLGFTHEDIEQMMKLKAEKWAFLQSRERGLKYPIPFEIHVTVTLQYIDDAVLDSFRDACKSANVKPIILDLQTQSGSILKDVMTSSTHFGNNASAYEESQRIVRKLKHHGYQVVRCKIETVPWHPAAPQEPNQPMPKDCYFEAHIPITYLPEHKEDVYEWVRLLNRERTGNDILHLSSNVFKKNHDGSEVVMVTYREPKMFRGWFESSVDNIVSLLSGDHWSVGKAHKEFSVYDTKVSHDAAWLLGEQDDITG